MESINESYVLRMLLIISFIALVTQTFAVCHDKNPTVKLEEGNIMGYCEIKPVGDVAKFLGVPYAEPPTGRNRFRPPMILQQWGMTLNTTQFSKACKQDDDWLQGKFQDDYYTSSEDCLYLNIYVPGKRNLSDQSIVSDLAVMVWIHGGQFQRGTASLYNPSRLVASNNVIVVTINYRLNVFGFLSLQKGYMGNFGLRDQTMALTWVQRNIAVFGGDRNLVTLFGHEAGASSILRHIASVRSQGLFQRAICQSVMPTSLQYPAKNTTLLLAINLRCATPNIDDIMACIRSRDISEIDKGMAKIKRQLSLQDSDILGPSNGDNWMPVDPTYNFTHGMYGKYIQILMGTSSYEGVSSLYLPIDRNMFEVNIEILAKGLQVSDYKKVAKMIFSRYMRDVVNEDYRYAFGSVFNDILSALAQDRVRTFSKHGTKVFNYRFSHQPSFAQKPYYLAAQHDEFISFVMGQFSRFNAEEVTLGTEIMKAWSYFAKTGTPTFDRKVNLDWHPYAPNNQSYIDLRMPLGPGNRRSRLNEAADIFWNEVVQTFKITPSTCAPRISSVSTSEPTADEARGTIFKWNIEQSEIAILTLVVITGAAVIVCIVVVISHTCHRRKEIKRNNMYNVETKPNRLSKVLKGSIRGNGTSSKEEAVGKRGKERKDEKVNTVTSPV